MPGMAFPVWVHGQLAAKLCLDAKDENQSPCFMLTRDTAGLLPLESIWYILLLYSITVYSILMH